MGHEEQPLSDVWQHGATEALIDEEAIRRRFRYFKDRHEEETE